MNDNGYELPVGMRVTLASREQIQAACKGNVGSNRDMWAMAGGTFTIREVCRDFVHTGKTVYRLKEDPVNYVWPAEAFLSYVSFEELQNGWLK